MGWHYRELMTSIWLFYEREKIKNQFDGNRVSRSLSRMNLKQSTEVLLGINEMAIKINEFSNDLHTHSCFKGAIQASDES